MAQNDSHTFAGRRLGMRQRFPFAALTTLGLLAAVVSAQPPRGGPPRGLSAALLLGQVSVRKELQLSADQIQKIEALEAKRREKMPALFEFEEPERGRKMQELNRETEQSLEAILTAEQGKRLKQILYQQQGPAAFADAALAQALGLSEEQQRQIRQINEETSRTSRALSPPGASPDADARARMEEVRKAGATKVLAVLTDVQRAAWKELQGEPFRGQLRFGPGGGGAKDREADPAKFLERITKALPDAAPARPRQRRKLLVFSRTAGFRHPSIPVGIKAITLMGDQTSAYLAHATEDESLFEPEKLKAFDAVLMLNTTGDCLRPRGLSREEADRREEAFKQSLVEFVRGGKGLLGIHAATDTYHRWKEYNQMMGGVFAGHPWTQKVPVKNQEPAHPLTAMFGGKDFEIFDEIYQFQVTTALPTERKFLLALDTSKMADARRGNRKEAGPYPISWVSTYGMGRTFYCSLGHREEIYCEPAILRHYLAGIQYALGDLEVDASPTEKPGKGEK
jgi:type 1 glutamine amidotransferase